MTGDTYAVFDNGTKARLTFNGDASAAKIFATTTGFANYEDLELRADNYLFKTGTTERMRIDSAGNVGIGGVAGTVTHGPHLDLVGNRGTLTVGTGYFEDNGSTNFIGGARSLAFGAVGSGERMRLDASGNLLVGTTNTLPQTLTSGGGFCYAPDSSLRVARQSDGTGQPVVDVNQSGSDDEVIRFRKDGATAGAIAVKDDTSNPYMVVGKGSVGLQFAKDAANTESILPCRVDNQNLRDNAISLGDTGARFKDLYLSGNAYVSDGTNGRIQLGGSTNLQIRGGSAFGGIRYHTNDGHAWYKDSSELMKLDSSGRLLVGTAVLPTSGTAGVSLQSGGNVHCGLASTSAADVMRFDNPNGRVGSITVGGSTTTYNTSSDERLKKNIADADDAGAVVDAIQVRKFDWISDGEHQRYGMVAQELNTVAPEAVTEGETEDDMMAVDYSKLVPMLVKEVQSLRARVAQLEGEN